MWFLLYTFINLVIKRSKCQVFLKMPDTGWEQWLMVVIPAALEGEIGG
jgi:hypothetical protein